MNGAEPPGPEGDRDQPGRDPRHNGSGPLTWAPQDTDRALEALRWCWGTVYEVGISGTGLWIAVRRDGLPAVTGNGPDALRSAILDDYAANPVRLP